MVGSLRTYPDRLAPRREMRWENRRIGNEGIVEVVGTSFYKQDFQVWIRFRETTRGDASCGSTTSKDDVDVGDGVGRCSHCECGGVSEG